MGNRNKYRTSRYIRRHAPKVQRTAGVDHAGYKKPETVFIDRGEESKFIWWIANNPYMLMRHKAIIKEVGGTIVSNTGDYSPKGLMMCASNFRFPKRESIKAVYIAHGTSNKGIGAAWGPEGRAKYDYYFVSGPKQAWCYKKYGHNINGERNVRYGNPVADGYLNNTFFVIRQGKEILGIRDDKPILLFAPTFGTGTFNRVAMLLQKYTDKYHVVITTHPREVLYEGAKSQLAWAKIFQGDIHDILWSADALIGDVGSTTYDFAITGKPILLIKPIAENMFYDHPKWMLDYNTPVCIPETEDIHAKFEEACERAEKKNRNGRNDLQEVYRRSFYRPFEGNGTEFAARWIQETVKKLWLR